MIEKHSLAGAHGFLFSAATCLILILPAMTFADDTRPYVAGFERFHRGEPVQSNEAEGGELLLSELNCRACHGGSGLEPLDRAAPNLSEIGSRADPKFLRDFLLNPATHQPGTTMPDVLTVGSEQQRRDEATALAMFLTSNSRSFVRTPPDEASVRRGQTLFRTVGCLACHPPRTTDLDADVLTTSRRFPVMEKKYSHSGLQRFLANPLAVRPSGRMPHMNLEGREASDLAHFLLQQTHVDAPLKYEVFTGRRRNLADDAADKLELSRTGNANQFDLKFPHRGSNYTARLSGFIAIPRDGSYTFHLHADDGARLFINEKLVIDNDSRRSTDRVISKSVTLELQEKRHAISVEYFQRGRKQELKLEWEGPQIEKQPVPSSVLSNRREPAAPAEKWVTNADLVKRGRELFHTRRCAQCHKLSGETPTALNVALRNTTTGCLAEHPSAATPNFRLDGKQRSALRAAVANVDRERSSDATTRIAASLKRLNCYACHERNSLGGVPDNRIELFSTQVTELGDEGRLPPSLTGVGDKLKPAWLSEVLLNRGTARPYMDARMPQFGHSQLEHLTADLVKADRKVRDVGDSPVAPGEARLVARRLVDRGRLQCVSCHDFNRHESVGIRAMDLTTMPARLNRDWFHQYMLNPAAFRPGTKMPAAWPGGRSLFRDELKGDAFRQIDAIWTYLADGRRAIPPKGLNRKSLELIVGGEAVVYRNKIREAGFRGICVGHPEQVNLSFDAETMRLTQIWKGRFLNVSPHWNVQGMGRIGPLGTDVITFPPGGPLAELQTDSDPWPAKSGKAAGYRFRGYELDALRRPAFLYSVNGLNVRDYIVGTEAPSGNGLKRTITVTTAGDSNRRLWIRLWSGESVDATNEGFRCDGKLQIRIAAATDAVKRESDGEELLVPVRLQDGRAVITVQYDW